VQKTSTVIPRLTKIIRSGITFVSRNIISRRFLLQKSFNSFWMLPTAPKQLMLSGVSLLAVSNVNNPVGLASLPYVTWSAHFFVTQIQTEKISSWNGPTVHVYCFMFARASTKTFVSRVRKTAKKSSLAENSLAGSLVSPGITV
jgi:hypothetical protein